MVEKCGLRFQMKPKIVYIYPQNDGDNQQKHDELAARFVSTYHAFAPGIPHDTVIVLNKGRRTSMIEIMFSGFQGLQFLERDGSAWDIGGYQQAAMQFHSEMIVFFGGSTYIRGPGWLKRMAEVFQERGPGLYGCMGNRGDARVKVSPHIRTTGFWTSSDLMNRYPMRIRANDARYGFEHGPSCFTTWVRRQSRPVLVVTWKGVYQERDWDNIPNGFHRGDQSGLLVGDRLTEPPFYHTP